MIIEVMGPSMPVTKFVESSSNFPMMLSTRFSSGLPLHFPPSITIRQTCHSSYAGTSQNSSLVFASSKFESNSNDYRDPNKDTRIHWGSSDEGWIGISDSPEPVSSAEEESISSLPYDRNRPLMGLLVHAADSHYRYLELTPDAEVEEIKAAYRRLSKTYHPDSTSLPLEVAASKFVRLKEAYNVLSSEQERRFYDWQLAQEISRQRGGRFIWPTETTKIMEDDGSIPPQVQVWESESQSNDPVDLLGGRNMDLSGQAQVALIFDLFALAVSVISIIYVMFFKQT